MGAAYVAGLQVQRDEATAGEMPDRQQPSDELATPQISSDPGQPETPDPAVGGVANSSDANDALDYEATDVAEDAAADFEVAGTDEQGRPLPVLPAQLVPNTDNAKALPGYHPDPIDAPASGPYTVVHGGRFYLRGTVGSENIRQELIRTNLLILPMDVLVIEYEIDSDEEWYLGDNYPVFLEDDVLFPPDSAVVDERFVPLFEIGANLLILDPALGIRITGHTDSQGTSDYNLDLSEARADAVRAQYLAFGAAERQVIAVGKGEAEPIADNVTDEGRQTNRRVEFEFISLED